MSQTDIAIIGMSCIFPGAADLAAFWKNIVTKKDAIQAVPDERLDALYFDNTTTAADRFYCNRGGFIPAVTFDPVRFGILPLAVAGMEPDQLLSLDLTCKALEDAGVLQHKEQLERTGIIIGKGNYAGPGATRAIEIVRTGEQIAEVLRHALPALAESEIEKVKREYQERKGRFGPDTAMGLIPNLVASLVANRLNLGGAAYTVDAACASSLLAVDQAIQEINSGRCDMMIAGGVHVAQNAAFWSIFNQLGALSRKQEIRPFDQEADGLLIGEGCGFVILKKLDEAIKDQNKIYAVIRGVGVSSDGSGASVMSPAVKGQVKAIQQAWNQAGIDVAEVGYIEAHGTGTPLGDKTELETLQQVFGRQEDGQPKAGIGSVKSNIGHAMPAAGIAGLIKTALALYHDTLPPTLHCRQPLGLMVETRFSPVSEPVSWSDSGLKHYAGVNAFGFGGINAHVVLEGYTRQNEIKSVVTHADKLLLLARTTQAGLLQALTDGETHIGAGDYRIALFDPTPERLAKAIKIVSKDKAWRNKQDIWFTNEPLLRNDAQLAFVFPGLDGLAGGEIESVAAHFGLPLQSAMGEGLLNQALLVLERSSILDTAVKRLGIISDMNAGHSLGEWLAARSSELAAEESVMQLLDMLDPETFDLKDSRFVAVGCGLDVMAPIIAGIPELYLSNDNCPSQVILCGSPAAIAQLTTILKARQVFHQVLPFQSGFHSPFVAGKLDVLLKGMDTMRFQKTRIPLWSATTLETYPDDFEAIKKLSVEHLVQPVRFRELILKLYDEGARVFIQVGSGGLTGFIDDTLKGKSYSAIASSVPIRGGIAQLQRVLAALFAEGRAVDLAFLGIDEQQQQPPAKGIQLALGLPLVKNWPALRELAQHTRPVATRPELSMADVAHPVMQAMQDNVDELIRMQEDMMVLFRNRTIPSGEQPLPAVVMQAIQPEPENQPFTQQLDINLTNHAYLIDHALLRQPKDWPCVQDMDPVIPMTMIFELFGEAAAAQVPGSKVHKILNTKVLQWMNVAQPFRETIQGSWKAPGRAMLDLERYAAAEVLLAGVLPAAPQIDEDTGTDLGISTSPAKIYEEHMFHGPAYQGIVSVTRVGDKGITGNIRGAGGKGSLLDNAGQLFGLWLQLTLTKDRIAFPVKIQEIAFYGDMQDQQGLFDCTCVLTALNDEFATANIIMKRNGKTWAIITGWQNRRLEIDEALWKVSMSPLHNLLSEEIAPGVFMFRNAYTRMVSWDFILKRYFNQEEKQYYQSLTPAKKKEWMISRVALKDAVRALLQKEKAYSCFPITFPTGRQDTGQPFVSGDAVAGIQVSLAHKGTDAVAIAANGRPVGIDIELIAARTEGFMRLSFTDAERRLVADREAAEWSTRLWVAKEAYGKMLGQGLRGNPRAYEVTRITEDRLWINDTQIQTIQYKNYIIGWTL
ncbi:type I polyketide synthase [Taibaiella chishuiensis]|uniref:Acyl transferase domain-containing protein n=1 Tax=Taibaiella chishuiensis TaxID=1434707 RepID=A0A2P8D2N2_9BACT|nr:type I polyketide synthase [Taibaiella chishuiensis]PSK91473.1 acyl transferase domain-containing protein [Taibaiella chishuiensis]